MPARDPLARTSLQKQLLLMGNQIPEVGMRNQCVEQGLGLGVLFRPQPDYKASEQTTLIRP
jgi:hypothetical protein